MQVYELNLILSQIPYRNKNSWEQTRFISYVATQTNSSKKIKPTDIIKFSWDKDNNTDKDINISKQDIERLKTKASMIAKTL
ncbi:hypothetical protein EZS27_008302 [termite gut metagenome]|uniref:Uncharacterized protein n=1 Tax=termite gut metagenome TaxID=433724 RepID=A0A5J4SF17_9ZZZZ